MVVDMMHKGFKVTAKAVRTSHGCGKAFEVKIDGHYYWTPEGFGMTRDKALARAIPYIDAAIERPEAYNWTRELTAAQLAAKIAR
jgi:hypothetical protein